MDSLGSWLTPSLPTGAPEKLVQGLGCSAVPPSIPPSPCLGSQSHRYTSVSGLCPSSLYSLSRFRPEAVVDASVTGASYWQNYFPLCWASISQYVHRA